jgi:recombination protein RecR
MNQEYPSALLERAVKEFSKLPGIGRKTATRLVLHLLRKKEEEVEGFSSAIITLKREAKYCKECHSISDTDICPICANPLRDHSVICVVENIQDVMAVENTMQFKGVYHVLGGVISPMDGVSPSDLQINSLIERVATGEVKEIILATDPTVEGETTASYISRLVKPLGIKVTRLAYGIPVGSDLEYADEVTLARALEGRNEL